MGRAPCCDKANVKRGPWSPEEDAKLKSYIQDQGTGGNWIALPQKIGLKRCGKSCRLRWLNYLRPNIKHGGFSDEEDNIICTLYMSIGSRWSIIAAQLPGRTDNDIKNYWNTRLKKKLMMGAKQRKEVQLQSRRSYVKVKPYPENNIMMIKKSVDDPDAISHLQIQSLPSYYTPRLPPDDQLATNNMPYLANPYPIPYPTHDPSQAPHQIKKNQKISTNFDFPFHISSGTVENCQLFNDNNNTIHFPANYSTQTYSSDLQSYLNNFPGIDQINERLGYGLDESKYLCGVDTVNGAGSFTGTSNSAESTSWKGDINSFVCSPIVSNINIYEEVRQLGISTFEEPMYNLGIH